MGVWQSVNAPVFVSKATLPALAKAIAEWFPELQGRSLAVSEAKITRDNIPTLPLVMVSLLRELGYHNQKTGRSEPEEQIVVEFWFTPTKYTSGRTETPFWAFYDYDTLRDRLVTHLKHWNSPRGERLEYFAMDVDSDQFATTITFQLRHKFTFCDLESPDDILDGWPMSSKSFEVFLGPLQEVCVPEVERDDCYQGDLFAIKIR